MVSMGSRGDAPVTDATQVCAKCGSVVTEATTYTTGVCPTHGIQPTIGQREYVEWIAPATHATLREQVARAVHSTEPWSADEPGPAHYAMADAVLVVFAEREQAIRAEYEACRVCGNPSGACEVPGACL